MPNRMIAYLFTRQIVVGINFTCSSLVNSFSEQFVNTIDGHSGAISVDSLSGGAEINRIFHERFPLDLIEVRSFSFILDFYTSFTA